MPWVFDSPLSDKIIPGSSKGRTIDFGSVDAWFEISAGLSVEIRERMCGMHVCMSNPAPGIYGDVTQTGFAVPIAIGMDLVFMSSSLMHHPCYCSVV